MAFSCGHRCTVGIDRDPPMSLDAQGGIKTKHQPFVVGVVLKSCGLGRGSERCVVVNILSTVGTENTYISSIIELWFVNSSCFAFFWLISKRQSKSQTANNQVL